MKEAIARGLEPDPAPKPIRPQALGSWQPFRSRSRRRMEPHRHARVLLEETSLPIEEIADIYAFALTNMGVRVSERH